MERKKRVLKEFTEEIRKKINYIDQKLKDDEVLVLIEDYVLCHVNTRGYDYKEKKELIDGIFNSTRKELDMLQPYADDDSVTEIMVNGPDNIFIERNGQIETIKENFESKDHLEEVIRRIASRVHREINELNPIVDARLEDGSRINAVYKNIALNGPILTIRKFPKNRITMDDLIQMGSITKDAAAFLEKLVISGYNIFISGGTSSGKTTFLNVLSNYIPGNERLVVIEDSAELQITEIKNIVRMETKNANVQGKGEVNIRQLIKASLRMRPDRIIVGEVRGEEALDMLQAMNTGHDGSLSTGHANSPEGMLSRLETMVLTATNFPVEAIRNQIASAIDVIIHLGRLHDRSRKVLEITEVCHCENGKIILNPIYLYQVKNMEEKEILGCLKPTGNTLRNTSKLEMKGLNNKSE